MHVDLGGLKSSLFSAVALTALLALASPALADDLPAASPSPAATPEPAATPQRAVTPEAVPAPAATQEAPPAPAPAPSPVATPAPAPAPEPAPSPALAPSAVPAPAPTTAFAAPPPAPAPNVPTDPLAKAAYDVLDRHCARCHQIGEKMTKRKVPPKGFGNVLALDEIKSDAHLIIPGNPDGSLIFQQIAKQLMPYDVFQEADLGQPSPNEADIIALRKWI